MQVTIRVVRSFAMEWSDLLGIRQKPTLLASRPSLKLQAGRDLKLYVEVRVA